MDIRVGEANQIGLGRRQVRLGIGFMRRISAIFVATCMVIIAGSVGAVLYLGLKFDAGSASTVTLAVLTAMVLFNTVRSRTADHGDLDDRIADLSRGSADLAKQVAELSRRVTGMETKVGNVRGRVQGAVDPLATEIGELGGLVKQIAETVARHATILQQTAAAQPPADLVSDVAALAAATGPAPAPAQPPATAANPAAGERGAPVTRRFRGMSRESIVALISKAADANRIDLYLQPIVTLPQRKVRYYEALSRLRTEDGDVLPAGDFIDVAEDAGLLPKLDHLLLFRCVQVTRRLQLKSRDVGVFCNLSGSTLADPIYFRQVLEFMNANRALNNALTFEFTQRAYRAFSPLEREALAALAELGFRFSMDHVTDLRLEPKDLAAQRFRFIKVPAALLLNPVTGAQSDIHPSDVADLMARSGIDLIAERIESESAVLDLLDFDVRFGQGFLFSPPRPVRVEALQGGGESDTGELAPTGTG
jgi:cyclic-di-GMP phosphodiesterase TipF (flagellum assembly factor)